MKNLFLFFFILIFSCSYSQSSNSVVQIFSYRLDFISDSTDIGNSKQEDFSLQYKNGRSCFVSDGYQKVYYMAKSYDSSPMKILSFNLGALPKSKFNLAVYKKADSIELYESLFTFKIRTVEKRSFKWKLFNEKKKIGSFNCQKAITRYAGREWEAWFTNDIPIPEGPYKFSGLPGLIVDIKDTKNSYHFYLTEIERSSVMPDLFFSDYFRNYKTISRSEYFRTREDLKNNYVNSAGLNGITIRQEDKRDIQNRVNKNNNPIELKP